MSRLTSFSLLLPIMTVLGSCSFTHAADVPDFKKWTIAAGKFAPALGFYHRSKVSTDATNGANKSVQVAGPLPALVPTMNSLAFTGDGVTISGKRIPLAPYDKAKHNKKRYAARWTFSLPKATRILLAVTVNPRDTRNSPTKAVYFNGSPLTLENNNLWTSSMDGELAVLGQAGENHIVAFSEGPLGDRPPSIAMLFGDAGAFYTATLQREITASPNAAQQQQLYTQLRALAGAGSGVGQVLGDGYAIFLHHQLKTNFKKDNPKDRKKVLDALYYFESRLVDSTDKLRFMDSARTHAPAWVFDELVFNPKSRGDNWKMQFWQRNLNALLLLRRFNQFDKLLLKITSRVKFAPGATAKEYDYYLRFLYAVVGYLQQAGEPSRALDLLWTLKPLWAEQKGAGDRRYKQIESQCLVSRQTAVQMSSDPGASTQYEEFRQLLDRVNKGDTPNPETLRKAFGIFAKYGATNRFEGSVVRSLKIDLKFLVDNRPVFATALRTFIAERLKARIETAILRRDLKGMNDVILRYSGLIDTDPLHESLMTEYFDRCEFENAYRHTQVLLRSANKSIARKAVAYALFLEKNLGFSGFLRTTIPEKLARSKVPYKGKRVSLLKLERIIWGAAAKQRRRRVLGPGKLIGTVRIPDLGRSYSVASKDLARKISQPLQPLEVGFGQDLLAVSGPNFLKTIDLKAKRPLWERSLSAIPSPIGQAPRIHTFPLEFAGQKILCLAPREDATGYTVVAFSRAGKKLWDMSDFPEARTWAPVSTPAVAFSACFVPVYDTSQTDRLQFGLARLNISTGRLENVTPLNQVTTSTGVGPSRFGVHFVKTQNALFGYSGSGVLFRVNGESLALDWGVVLPQRRRGIQANPPGFIQAYPRAVVAHLPGPQEWVGVRRTDGEILWRFVDDGIRWVHSRYNRTVLIVSSHSEDGVDPILKRIDPRDGKIIWQQRTNGLWITGEGAVQGELLYVPTIKGIAVFHTKDGSFKQFYPMNITPDKIRIGPHHWAVFASRSLHLFDNSGVFEGAKAKYPTSKVIHKESALPPRPTQIKFEGLYLERALPRPFERIDQRTLKVIPTAIPFHYLLQQGENLALLREGYAPNKNSFVEPKVLWADRFPGLKLNKGRIITYTKQTVEVLDSITKRNLFTWRIPLTRPPTGRVRGEAIYYANIFDDSVAIWTYNKAIRVFGLADRQLKFQFKTEGGGYFGSGSHYLLTKFQNKEVRCYDLRQKGKRIWKHPFKQRWGNVIRDKVFLGVGNTTQMVDIATGKVKTYNLKQPNWSGKYYYTPPLLSSSGNRAIDLRTNRPAQGILLSHSLPTGEVIILSNKTFTLHRGNKALALPMPESFFLTDVKKRRGTSMKAWIRGQQLLVNFNGYNYSWLQIHSLADGKLKGKYPFGALYRQGNGSLLSVLDRSCLVYANGRLNFLGDRGRAHTIFTQIGSTLVANDSIRWPEKGWFPSTPLQPNFWEAEAQTAPERQITLNFGADKDYVYLHLKRPIIRNPKRSSHLRASFDWRQDASRSFLVYWNMDIAASARVAHLPAEEIDSWKQLDEGKGEENFYIRVAKKSLPLWRDFLTLPNMQLEIEERIQDSIAGRYRYGGIFSQDPSISINRVTHRIDCQTMEDFRLREAIYTKSNSFLPQGFDLANWIRSRRVLKGIDDNIQFLTSMAQRTKRSPAVINVLTTLVLEKIEKLREAMPEETETSPRFVAARTNVLAEVLTFAKGLGISEIWIRQALTMITIDVYRTKFVNSSPFAWWRIGGRKQGRIDLRLSTSSLFCGAQNRPHAVTIFPGLFSGRALIDLGYFVLPRQDPHAILNNLRVYQPGSVRVLIKPDGKPMPGVSLPKAAYKTYLDAVGKLQQGFWLKAYQTTMTFPPFPLGDIGKNLGLTAKDFLLALKNLPSDSRIGSQLIDGYRNITTKDPQALPMSELGSILLQRTNHSVISVRDTVYRLRIQWEREGLKGDALLTKTKEYLSKNKVLRSQQRAYFLPYRDFFYHQKDKWLSIGAFPSGDKDLIPSPGLSTDPAADEFLWNKKSIRFSRFNPKEKSVRQHHNRGYRLPNATNQRAPTLAYHVIYINATKAKKVWVFLARVDPRDYSSEIAVWHNGRPLLKETFEQNEDALTAAPVRLDKGKNVFVVRTVFTRNWDIRFSLGDSYGLAVKGVSILNPPLTVK